MPPRGLTPSGLVLVDKPSGPSSFTLVKRIRSSTGARAGHAGTLDPFASGLLLILLGSSTRLARYLVGLDKRYVTDVDLSFRTSTGDPEGEHVEVSAPPDPSELEARLAGFRGEVALPIPAVSAVKIGGQRAYRLARRGVRVEMPIRHSTVHELALSGFDGRVARLELRVSSGTYVRAIADALGGHCRTLRRTEVGPFSVDDADPERILSPKDALPFLPSLQITAAEAAAIRRGRRRIADAVRVLHEDDLVAVNGTVLP